MEANTVADLWRSLRDRAMEKDSKEWGSKAQRASLKALRDLFPQVDVRILKGTVLDHGDDIDAAVDFILTEVLEKPMAGKFNVPHNEEQISQFNVQETLSELPVETANVTHSGSLSVYTPTGSVNITQVECGMSDDAIKSLATDTFDLNFNTEQGKPQEPEGEYRVVEMIEVFKDRLNERFPQQDSGIVMAESLTESEPDAIRVQLSGHVSEDDIGFELLMSPSVESRPIVSSSGAEVNEESTHSVEFLYGSVTDVAAEVKDIRSEVQTSTMETSWSDEENSLEKHVNSQGSRWAYDNESEYLDLQEWKSSSLAVPSGQFDSMSGYTDEGSRLMESSILEETMDGLFNSTSDTLMSGSLQLLSVDVLDKCVNDAKSDKEALLAAIEEMKALRCMAEQAEAAAEVSKKAAVNGGLCVLTKVDEMRVSQSQAREANEMRAGEVYGEKAMLGTESQELQLRLARLKREKDEALAAVNEMRASLQARISRATEEREEAEAEKRLKEESARKLLAIEEELMAKVAQESLNLDAEEEACTKLREFLIEQGSAVDALQGEVAIIYEDVEVLKKQLEEGIRSGGSSSVQMMSSCSSLHSSFSVSLASAGEGNLKIAESGSSHFGGLSSSGSSYQSAPRTGKFEDQVGQFPALELGEKVSMLTSFEYKADQALLQSPKTGVFHHSPVSSDDEGWHLLDTSSNNGNESSIGDTL